MNPKATQYPNSGLVQLGSPMADLCEFFRHDVNGRILFPSAPAWLLNMAEAEAQEVCADSEQSEYTRRAWYILYCAIRATSPGGAQ